MANVGSYQKQRIYGQRANGLQERTRKKYEQKKVDTWEKTGKKYGKNEQNWQTTKLYIILQQNCVLF